MPNAAPTHRPPGAVSHEQYRPNAAQRGYCKAAWKRLRRRVLRRDPFCVKCERAVATEADHITPRAQGGDDTMGNLQGLCRPCHSRKTREETSMYRGA